MALDPVAVALKFGFLAILYLFLLWMARSALKDLRRSAYDADPGAGQPDYSDATGMHAAGSTARPSGTPKLRVGSGAGLRAGAAYDLSDGALLGRGDQADIVLDDANVSRKHAEVRPSGGSWIVRDLGSTNGVKVNGRRIQGPQSLAPGDVVELGTSRVVFDLG